jgi:cytidyltransferase-like protein
MILIKPPELIGGFHFFKIMILFFHMILLPRERKIKSIDELAEIIDGFKKAGKKIVQAHGIFDLVHPAHIHYLEESKKLGDVLVVSAVEDRFVHKGPGRPFFGEDIRLKWLAAFEIVDYAVFCGDVGPYNILRKIKPHFYTKGEGSKAGLSDPKSGISEDKRVCQEVGAKLVFTKELPFHSSEIFEKIIKIFD